jgi:hypothetical protein
MNILLTGCTAAQVSEKKNSRSTTFTGLLYKALTKNSHNVTWIEPSVSLSKEYISEFDSVLVGLAPPTSTAAHKIYGALSVIYHAQSEHTLRLFLDAPEPKKVWAGIRAIHNNPESLVKDFYAKRSEYTKTRDPEVFSRITSAVSSLYNERWPKTIFPTLPWMSFSSVSTYIPQTDQKNLVGVSFDYSIYKSHFGLFESSPQDFWVSDSINTSWVKSQENLIEYPVVPLKTSRWELESKSLQRLSTAIGCLASIYKNGDPWWSPAIAQSLALGTPVVSDWLLTSMLGPEWSHLPSAVEAMGVAEKRALADSQASSYFESLLSEDKYVELLTRSLAE